MWKKRLAVPLSLSLAAFAALLCGLSPADRAAAALPTPVARHVAVTGSDISNDCQLPSSPCRTVQHAVDVADAGEVIKVAQGTYNDVHARTGITQVLLITRSVTLVGGYTMTNEFAGPPQPSWYTTTLDAEGRGRVVVVDADDVSVRGFVIRGGAGYFSGGGIHAAGVSELTLRENRIEDNSASGEGAGVFISRGSAEIVDNNILGNASTWSAGLRLINNADVVVKRNLVGGNVARIAAGGIDVGCCGRSTPLLAQNVVIDNDGGSSGGGIRVQSTSALVVNNVLARNQGDRGSGVYLRGTASFPVSATLLHNTLVGHDSSDEGLRTEGTGAVTMVNTILVGHAVGITNASPTSATVIADHVLVDGNGIDYGSDVGVSGETVGSPAFVSPLTDDYHLTGLSAAINAGVWAGVSIDIDDELRLYPPDLGADEYWLSGGQWRAYLPIVMVVAVPAELP